MSSSPHSPLRLPLIAPNPPRLSDLGEGLARVEASGIFSNNGPEVRAFERDVTAALFGGVGASLAVTNATLGLMIAIRDAAGMNPKPGTLAVMPALTFAATAQAAYWAGLTPLVVDIDPDDWSAAAAAEERALERYGTRVGVLVPYATFGNAIDLDRYRRLSAKHGVGVVIDAASSLGTIDDAGDGFGARMPFATVYSMHATKTFSVAEGGLVHCADQARIDRLRSMTNFGFEGARSATLPGINAKLPEVLALMARAKLAEIETVCERRATLEATYREELADFTLQAPLGRRRAMQFMPVLLPPHLAQRREAVTAAMAAAGVGTGRYFSPHLGEQPWVRSVSIVEATPVADRVAGALLSLPITDAMTLADAARAAQALLAACRTVTEARPYRDRRPLDLPDIATTLIVGGGPAGTALLNAATKRGDLARFAQGLVMVERDVGVGNGRLGRYAITSDSTAKTFLTAVADNPHPELADLVDHPAGRAVAAHADALGVPLVEVGPLLRETGERLAELTRVAGGHVLTRHDVVSATRTDGGLWRVRLRRLADGEEFNQLARNVVIATGGHQPLDRLAGQVVAGAPLRELAQGRLVQSDEVLTLGGVAHVADLLAGKRSPRIAVIGGSTSALTTVALLLKAQATSTGTGLPLGAGGITLLHRRPLRPFYPSVEAAQAEGFTDFGSDDVCPVSGFVYRLAGFRLEARDLVLRMLGVDGRSPDPRVALHRIAGDDDAEARAILRGADLVIAAMGYRPFALPVLRENGAPLPLAANVGKPMVDPHCRVVDSAGVAIPGLYGIGLAAGFVPWGKLGGEASFRGQANGLWLWQNDVGLMIVDQVLAEAEEAVAAA